MGGLQQVYNVLLQWGKTVRVSSLLLGEDSTAPFSPRHPHLQLIAWRKTEEVMVRMLAFLTGIVVGAGGVVLGMWLMARPIVREIPPRTSHEENAHALKAP